MAVFADDSGLEVEALNGAPGVYSARYAGVPKDDQKNNQKLLTDLRQATNRKARFVTVITLLINGQVHYFEGEVSGTITHEARGKTGFGYDPLFIPTGYRSTFAELGPEVKNSISHRAAAVSSLIRFLAG
jgi:XTP/dITP diphosphohydrolase